VGKLKSQQPRKIPSTPVRSANLDAGIISGINQKPNKNNVCPSSVFRQTSDAPAVLGSPFPEAASRYCLAIQNAGLHAAYRSEMKNSAWIFLVNLLDRRIGF
jgi:hypothetical protein